MRIILLALLLPLAGCDPSGGDGSGETASGFSIEMLRHEEEGPVPVGEVDGVAVGSSFELAGTEMLVTDLWEHAVSVQETTDDNPEPNHAFEVAWRPEQGEKQWIHQAETDGPALMLDGVPVAIRVVPPGARPAGPETDSFASRVQFFHDGCRHDLPEVGGEVFPGWKLKSSRQFQRALMEDDGSLVEEEDAGFVNRVLEAHVVADDGSEERHIVFLDHPELTRGIHPTILPVSRVSGEKTSLARLVVCPEMPAASEQHQVWISPGVGEGPSVVRVVRKGGGKEEIQVDEYPAGIEVAEGVKLQLLRHFTRARSIVRWERADAPSENDATPALVVEHFEQHETKRLVLIEDEITPCRIGGEMVMLRLRAAAD